MVAQARGRVGARDVEQPLLGQEEEEEAAGRGAGPAALRSCDFLQKVPRPGL